MLLYVDANASVNILKRYQIEHGIRLRVRVTAAAAAASSRFSFGSRHVFMRTSFPFAVIALLVIGELALSSRL